MGGNCVSLNLSRLSVYSYGYTPFLKIKSVLLPNASLVILKSELSVALTSFSNDDAIN